MLRSGSMFSDMMCEMGYIMQSVICVKQEQYHNLFLKWIFGDNFINIMKFWDYRAHSSTNI